MALCDLRGLAFITQRWVPAVAGYLLALALLRDGYGLTEGLYGELSGLVERI